MISAVIYYDDFRRSGDKNGGVQGMIWGYTIEGHAGMAKKGHDLVCASVSALAQTALLGLDAHLSTKPVWKISEKGLMECRLPDGLPAAELEKAQIILNTMLLGLLSIEESYGQYLQVSKRRWTGCFSK